MSEFGLYYRKSDSESDGGSEEEELENSDSVDDITNGNLKNTPAPELRLCYSSYKFLFKTFPLSQGP